MKIALEEALVGIRQRHGGPFGAVIVKDDVIVSQAHNCVVLNGDPTAHAEVLAIREACKKLNTYDLSGCVLYTTAIPCIMCKGAILWARIRTIYYGCDLSDTHKIGYDDLKFEIENNNLNFQQIMHDECLELFNYYNKFEQKIVY